MPFLLGQILFLNSQLMRLNEKFITEYCSMAQQSARPSHYLIDLIAAMAEFYKANTGSENQR